MGEVRNHRRYMLGQQRKAEEDEQHGIASGWLYHRQQAAGTDFPADFPRVNEVLDAGYLAVEDLDGADADELADYGVSDEAEVLAAVAEIMDA